MEFPLAQVTLSVMLLIGAGLFVRSVARVGRLHLGYDADHLLLVEAHLRGASLDSAQKVALRRALMEQTKTSRAIESASLVCTAPFYGTCSGAVFVAEIDSTNRLGEFVKQSASPTYFATTGTRILRGRVFSTDDRAGGGDDDPVVTLLRFQLERSLIRGARGQLDAIARLRSVERLLQIAAGRHTDCMAAGLQRWDLDGCAWRRRKIRFSGLAVP